MFLKTISNNIEYIWTIKKSKFITNIYPVYSKEDIDFYLSEIRKKYSSASHHCYAYILDENIKVSDDKEPSGTAGLPILKVLKYHDLNHVLCVVTRYFGGIKLGSGGLVRAYTKSVTDALKDIDLIEDVIKVTFSFSTSYSNQKQVDYLLKDYTVLTKDFSDVINYTILIDEDDLDILKNKLDIYIKNC